MKKYKIADYYEMFVNDIVMFVNDEEAVSYVKERQKNHSAKLHLYHDNGEEIII